MSYSRGTRNLQRTLLNRVMNLPRAYPIAAATGIGVGLTTVYLLNRFEEPKAVVMRPTQAPVEGRKSIDIMAVLKRCLADGANQPSIFIAFLRRQELSSEEAITMAKLAIKNAHVIELETLTKAYPDDVTETLIVNELMKTRNPHTFRELLEASAEDKLQRLRFLFDPKQSFTIVEVNDIKAYFAAVNSTPQLRKTIVMVDSEYYDPSIKVQVLPPRHQVNAQGLLLFARHRLREMEVKLGQKRPEEPSMVGRHF